MFKDKFPALKIDLQDDTLYVHCEYLELQRSQLYRMNIRRCRNRIYKK